MSTKALLTAAAAGALLFGAGSAYAKSDSVRAIDLHESAVRHMQRTAIPTQLDALAETPDYYAVTPIATLDTASSPDYYATVATPAEFYATIAPQTQFAYRDDIVVNASALTQSSESFDLAVNDDILLDTDALTVSTADASATVNYPQAIEAADAAVTAPMPATLEIVSSAPVPDTRQNRALYGQPLSRAGRLTAPVGN